MTTTTSAPTLKQWPSPLRLSIHHSALSHNFLQIKQFISSTTKILAIIKADAYGHGAVSAARTLEPLDPFGFGVASIREGIALRTAGITHPILVMGPLLEDHIPDIIQHRFTPIISHEGLLRRLHEHLPSSQSPYPIHIKIDTGLHRLGFDPDEAKQLILGYFPKIDTISLQGLMTHFADADSLDPSLTLEQIQRFFGFIQELKSIGHPIPLYHMANSAGILFHPSSHLDLIRPGLMLYGYAPRQSQQPCPLSLQPVMEAKTYIAHLRSLQPGERVGYNAMFRTRRPSHIAVLPIGYTHGFPRHLTGKGHVLIKGVPAPIIGKICMDMMMIDVTEIPEPKIGEEVVLLGRQGEREITAEDHARWLDTIPYEVLCGIGRQATQREDIPSVPPPNHH